MVDLPNHSVLIAGLDYWSKGGDEIIEPRLTAKLAAIVGVPSLRLFSPPPDQDDPLAPQTGIDAFQFPEWFITQDVESADGESTVRSRMLVHRKALTRGKFIDLSRKKRAVVPVRFVRACRAGHIGDIDWYGFVHGPGSNVAVSFGSTNVVRAAISPRSGFAVNAARANEICPPRPSWPIGL